MIVDADLAARVVQEPGSPVLDEDGASGSATHVITESGMLDRAAVASIVFTDPDALKDLNKIVHPAVAVEMNDQVLAQRETDRVVVMDIPLLTENPRIGLQAVIVVDVPVEAQVERLVKYRGFDEADARARIARQSSREDRLKLATHVIDNSLTRRATSCRRSTSCGRELTALPQLPAGLGVPASRSRSPTPK